MYAYIITHLFSIPLKASFEWTLVLVDKPEGVAKLMQDSGPINKPKVHCERLFRYSSSVGTNVGPRAPWKCMTETMMKEKQASIVTMFNACWRLVLTMENKGA